MTNITQQTIDDVKGTGLKNGFTFKQNIAAFGIMAVFFLGLLAWAQLGNAAPEKYQPKAPEFEQAYNISKTKATAALRALCSDWKNLSKAKIEDKVNGVAIEDKVNQWNSNLTVDCSKIESPVTFQ